jgi:hypothetical protein
MGIETKGLALESLASLDAEIGAPAFGVAVDEAR